MKPMSDTVAKRPLPPRPTNGLLAWQATIGYISTTYSLDAMLTLQAYPDGAGIAWGAKASWGQRGEEVTSALSLPVALRDLWQVVDHNHVIFESREALIKRPTNYDDDEWLDADTEAILEQVLQASSRVYGDNWQLVAVYQPVESPNTRFQARLLARDNSVQIGGSGPTLCEACRSLYRNAAPYFVAR
jgi:hypothetical protein